MKSRDYVKPFAPLRNDLPGVVAVLTAEEAARWHATVRARLDATRAAELAALRARVAIAEAVEAEIAMVREMAARHGFDPNQAWALTPEGHVVRAPQQEGLPA